MAFSTLSINLLLDLSALTVLTFIFEKGETPDLRPFPSDFMRVRTVEIILSNL